MNSVAAVLRQSVSLRHGYGSVLAAIVAGVALTLAGAHLERQRDHERLLRNLALLAVDETARIQRSVDSTVEVLESIGSFYAGSDFVGRREFGNFVRSPLANHPEIRALEWAPRIDATERARFEAGLGRVLPGRGIRMLDAHGRLTTAAAGRREYFPIAYVEPLAGNEPALGFDVTSRAATVRTLERAIERDETTVTSSFTLVQGGGQLKGVAVYRPVYRNGAPIGTAAQRHRHLLGFAVAILEPKELVLSGLRPFRPTALDVLLVERIDGRTEVLHFHPSRVRRAPVAAPTPDEVQAGLHHEAAIRVPGGEWTMLYRPAPEFFQEHQSHQAWLILIAGLALTAVTAYALMRRVRYVREILDLARLDGLTGLPNRLLLRERLELALARAERQGGQLAVLFLDLDHFKHINDSLGHATGDRVLQEVGRRLAGAVRKQDMIARMGGDEFILLAPELRHEQDAAQLASKLLQALTEPCRIEGRSFYLSASIGISLYPRDAASADALVANADAAMYRAKASGRNTFEFYTHELTAAATERLRLEAELRDALHGGAIEAHYQPQIDLATGRVIGAEALARWRHPEHGDIAPDRFIPLAKDTGLIVELGESMLRQACHQARLWLDQGAGLQGMAVNVAGEQIQRGDFVAMVRRVLDETGLPPRLLELEVSEGFFLWHGERSIDVLRALGELGVTLSIDDFGTGYSSLAYLKRLPIDKLKIDRSFVRDLPDDEDDAAIARAVVALAHSLGLRVLAEGVETAAQRDFLRRLGCEEAQGFLFGRPVPAREFPLATTAAAGG